MSRRVKHAFYGLLFVCSICLSAYSQTEHVLGRYAAQRWGAEQGLIYGRISSLAQTSDGYLWIGTEKNLIRFDGYSFLPVKMADGGAVASLTDLVVDRQGSLWLRAEDGELLHVVGKRVSSVLSPERGYQRIIALAPAQQSGVLVSGLAEGVLLVDRGRPQRLHLEPPHLAISLAQTESGIIWLGTRGGGLFHSGDRHLSAVASVGKDTKINCLLQSGPDGLWIGTDTGLLNLDVRSNTVSKRWPASGDLQVLAMVEDHEGQLWVGTSEGLLVLTGDRLLWVLHTGRAVTAVLSDREGNVWFGDGDNLERLRDTPVMTYALPLAPSQGSVGAVAIDSHGRTWFAPVQGGLYWMFDGHVHTVSANGLDRDVVYSIDSHGDAIWLGRKRGGLTRLLAKGDDIRSQTWTRKDGLPGDSVYSVRAMTDGSVWAAGLTGGVSHLTNGHITRYDRKQIGTGSIAAVEATTDGAVWFATSNGLVKFHSGIWTRLADAANLSSQEILSLCADEKNGMYVGTSRGIVYLDSAGKKAMHSSVALPNDPILGIALDGHGTVWLSTTSQVLSVAESAWGVPTTAAAVREYSVADGLANSSGVRRARSMVADAGGQVLFSTEGGLSIAHRALGASRIPAFPRIESIVADGVLLPESEPARVPAGTRRITLNLAGLDLRAPEQVQLRYRLDDFDRTWSDSSASREATYTNLQPGTYHFRLLARSSQGEWGEQESVLPIIVEPLLQQRWSLRIALTLALISLAAWILHARINFVTVQMNILADERHAERNRIARELHDTLLQGILSVMLRLHVITEGIDEPSATRNALHTILNLMERVTDEARFAVQGLRSTVSSAIDLESLFCGLEANVLGDANAKYRVEVRGRRQPLHPHICQEIIRIGLEAIQNAIRHARSSVITVHLLYAKRSLTVEIVDNGIGMEADLVARGKDGHWGMLGMRERTKDIGAELHIVSVIGKGTKVTLVVPARLAYRYGRRPFLPVSRSKVGS